MDERDGGWRGPRLPLVAAALVVPTALAGLALLWPGAPAASAGGPVAAVAPGAAAPPPRTTAPRTTAPSAPATPAPGAGAAAELDEAAKAELRAGLAAVLAATPLTFRPNSAEPAPEAVAALGAVVELLRTRPTARLQVDGFVATGPSDGLLTAQELSDARAAAVRDALVVGGVPAARIATRGLGEGGDPRPGAAGRRVEITVV